MNKIIIAFLTIAFVASTSGQFILPRPVVAAAAPVVPVPLYNSYVAPFYRGFIYPSYVIGSNKNKDTSAPSLKSPFIPKNH